MTTKTYNNLNYNLNLENISLMFSRFWINEILSSNNTNIILSITVLNRSKKAFVLIKDSPFNNYNEIIIKLKEVVGSNSFTNRKNILTSIVFDYNLENKYSWKGYDIDIIILISYYILLVYGTFIFFDIINELLITTPVINNSSLEVFDNNVLPSIIQEDTINNNKCLFNVFSNFFVKPSHNSYYPSYFVDSNIILSNDNKSISLVNLINSQQFYVLNKTVQSFIHYFNSSESLKHDLNAIITEYSNYNKICYKGF